MYSLILDTSFRDIGVALYNDEVLVDSVCYDAFRKQSELLVVEIKKMLEKNKVTPENLKIIYVNNGPGSYTGIRMSLAVSKTFSFAYNTQIVLVSSLLAQVGFRKEKVLSLIDARADRAYMGIVENGIVTNEAVLSIEQIIVFIQSHQNLPIVSNFQLGDIGTIHAKSGVVGIGELIGKIKPEKDPLRVEPFYFKEAV